MRDQPPIPYDVHQQQIGRVLYEVECIIDHCKDQPGWRFDSIKKAAERIEAVFCPTTEPVKEPTNDHTTNTQADQATAPAGGTGCCEMAAESLP